MGCRESLGLLRENITLNAGTILQADGLDACKIDIVDYLWGDPLPAVSQQGYDVVFCSEVIYDKARDIVVNIVIYDKARQGPFFDARYCYISFHISLYQGVLPASVLPASLLPAGALCIREYCQQELVY